MTQEDWNEVLYSGMDRTSSWAALYFIALMTFGNYVLFNLLVAILVEGFSTEDEPRKPLTERIIEDAMNAIKEEARSRDPSNYGDSRNESRMVDLKDEAGKIITRENTFENDLSSKINDTNFLKKRRFLSINSEDYVQQKPMTDGGFVGSQPPIITTTCPTPLLKRSPTYTDSSKRLMMKHDPFKSCRSLSIDSSFHKIKVRLLYF